MVSAQWMDQHLSRCSLMTTESDSTPPPHHHCYDESSGTSLFNGVQTDVNEPRDCGSLTLAEGLKMATKNPIWHKQRVS